MPKKQAKSKIKLSIVIPVLNEGTNLKILLRMLKAMVDAPHEVLVVHDIPADNSIPVVRSFQKIYPRLRLVHNSLGRGVIFAIKSGVNEAAGEYVLVIAADDIGPLMIINDMLSLMEQGCDLVNGTRYAYGGKNIGGIFASRMLSSAANRMFHILSGCALTDPTLGVKMFRKNLFNKVMLVSKPVGWAVSFELAIKVQAVGWKLGEVPVISLNRLYGKGKSSFKTNWLGEYLKWFFYGIKNLALSGRGSKSVVRIPERMAKE